jgi:hypothetical protein
MANDEHFFDRLPAFSEFAGVADNGNYTPLPEGWVLATADIVGSTKAIAAGRYKAVNMAGASVISAVMNALGHRDFPFVFGGDGALVAVPPSAIDRTYAALAAVQVWVGEELDLTLRAALVPMADIRKAGHDVLVARFRTAPEVAYAMFAGGGASWAEAEMKAGRYAVPKAAPGTRPDLTGLSCRWDPIAARNGDIVSVIAVPAADASAARFAKLTGEVIALVASQERGGHPVPPNGPNVSWVPAGFDYELRAMARKGQRLLARLSILFQIFVIKVLDRTTRKKLGRLDFKLYRADVVRNSDFRKFDDGLKLTVDLDPARLARLETLLEDARKAGIAQYGLHRQKDALMTCLVPSPFTRDHLHFIDGAAGGYAMAASFLKERRAAA